MCGRLPPRLEEVKAKEDLRSLAQLHGETEAQGRAVFLPASKCLLYSWTLYFLTKESSPQLVQGSEIKPGLLTTRAPVPPRGSAQAALSLSIYQGPIRGGLPPLAPIPSLLYRRGCIEFVSLLALLKSCLLRFFFFLDLDHPKIRIRSFPQPENHGFDIQDVCCPGPDICLTLTLLTPRPHRWLLWEQSQLSTSLPRAPETVPMWLPSALTPPHSQGCGAGRTVTTTASQKLSDPRQGCFSFLRGCRKWVKGPGVPPDEGTDAWQVSILPSGSGQGKGGLSKCSSLHHQYPHTLGPSESLLMPPKPIPTPRPPGHSGHFHTHPNTKPTTSVSTRSLTPPHPHEAA